MVDIINTRTGYTQGKYYQPSIIMLSAMQQAPTVGYRPLVWIESHNVGDVVPHGLQ
jgi:hypothetical protein